MPSLSATYWARWTISSRLTVPSPFVSKAASLHSISHSATYCARTTTSSRLIFPSSFASPTVTIPELGSSVVMINLLKRSVACRRFSLCCISVASPSLLGVNRINCYLYKISTNIFTLSICSLHYDFLSVRGRYVNTFYKLGKIEHSARVSIEFIKL